MADDAQPFRVAAISMIGLRHPRSPHSCRSLSSASTGAQHHCQPRADGIFGTYRVSQPWRGKSIYWRIVTRSAKGFRPTRRCRLPGRTVVTCLLCASRVALWVPLQAVSRHARRRKQCFFVTFRGSIVRKTSGNKICELRIIHAYIDLSLVRKVKTERGRFHSRGSEITRFAWSRSRKAVRPMCRHCGWSCTGTMNSRQSTAAVVTSLKRPRLRPNISFGRRDA